MQRADIGSGRRMAQEVGGVPTAVERSNRDFVGRWDKAHD
jgi:hypothetical protein